MTVQRLASSLQLLNDGRPESGLSIVAPGYGNELILQGSLPVLRCGRIERAAAVGIGAGHTVGTLLAGGFRHVDAIELEPAVLEAARFMHEATAMRKRVGMPGFGAVLKRPAQVPSVLEPTKKRYT